MELASTTKDSTMIVDAPPVLDHEPRRQKLRSDIGAATSDVRGRPAVDMVVILLERAEQLAAIADGRGEDLTPIRAFFGGEA
jgi:hypothetical protein